MDRRWRCSPSANSSFFPKNHRIYSLQITTSDSGDVSLMLSLLSDIRKQPGTVLNLRIWNVKWKMQISIDWMDCREVSLTKNDKTFPNQSNANSWKRSQRLTIYVILVTWLNIRDFYIWFYQTQYWLHLPWFSNENNQSWTCFSKLLYHTFKLEAV